MLVLVGHYERSFSLQINKTKDINSTVGKRFFHDIISLYIALVWNFNSFFNISFNCKYPAGNCMFGVDNGGAGAACGVCSRLVVMYMYMYMCMCECMYICLCLCMCMYICICVCVYIYECVYVCMYIYMYVCMCVYVYM